MNRLRRNTASARNGRIHQTTDWISLGIVDTSRHRCYNNVKICKKGGSAAAITFSKLANLMLDEDGVLLAIELAKDGQVSKIYPPCPGMPRPWAWIC